MIESIMRTFLWAALTIDQLALLLVASLKLQQFELSEFAFRQQLEHHSGTQARLRKALYKQLPQVKALVAVKLALLLVVGASLFSVLTQPALGIVYALLSLLIISALRRVGLVQQLAEKAFFATLEYSLKAANILSPLWSITGLPPKREVVLAGSLEEFNDQLRRLPSTVLPPQQRQRLESVLAAEDKTVKEIMTPKKRVVTVEPSATLGPVVLADLQKSGHGYFPVATKKGEPEGILALGDLTDIQLAKQRSQVRELMSSHIAWIEEDVSLYELTEVFLKEKQYIILVRNPEGEFSGVVTVADLMKHLLGVVKD